MPIFHLLMIEFQTLFSYGYNLYLNNFLLFDVCSYWTNLLVYDINHIPFSPLFFQSFCSVFCIVSLVLFLSSFFCFINFDFVILNFHFYIITILKSLSHFSKLLYLKTILSIINYIHIYVTKTK